MVDQQYVRFSSDNSLGYVHTRDKNDPIQFHGRFAKNGNGPEALEENQGWHCLGSAQGEIRLPRDQTTLLEVLPDSAKDLSALSRLAADAFDAIWLGNTYVNDTQLPHLAHLSSLRWLDIQNNGEITDAGVLSLQGLESLEWLGLHWTRISSESMKLFEELPSLKFLDIWGCQIDAQAISEFQAARPDCKIRLE